MTQTVLSDRSSHLLTTLVARYIRDGVPVGSKTLAQDAQLALSAASVRNIMAELEEAGFIRSPHTSAGRVPTDRGYRLFVDRVVTGSRPSDSEAMESVRRQLPAEQWGVEMSAEKLAQSASTLLSSLTQQAGLVLLPRRQSMAFRQVEFLPLSSQRVLVILVLDEQDVQNHIIHTDRNYSQQQLQQAAAYVNRHYSGRDVQAVRSALLASMEEDKSVIDQLMQAAIDMASQALVSADQQQRDYIVAGQANLLSEQDNVAHLRELFEAFQQKEDILHLMERCAASDGVQVFIGEEAGYEVLDDFSLITAPYQTQGQPIGVLGVIGPTRMAYDRVVPMVDITAQLLSAALKD